MKHLMKLSMVIGIIWLCFFSMGDFTIAHAGESNATNRCGDFGYSLNSDGTCNLEYYYGEGGTVTVPAKLDGHTVCKLNAYCFVLDKGNGGSSVNTTVNRLILPEGLEEIEDGAIWCDSLEYISLPASLESLGWSNDSFRVGTSTEFEVNPGNQKFCSYEKGLFSKDMTILYHGYVTDEYYTVPNTVVKIDHNAFENDNTICHLIIPSGVRTLESGSFEAAQKLETIRIFGNNVSIWEYSFSHCPQLREFWYAGNKLRFRHGVFWEDSNFTDLYFGGTKEEYAECKVDMDQNEPLTKAVFHYSSSIGILWNEVSGVSDGVKLSWNGLSRDDISYKVYRRRAESDNFVLLKTLTGTEYVDKKVVSGTRYIYYVEQADGSGTNRTQDYPVVYLKQLNVTKCENTEQGIRMTWQTVSGATSYEVYFKRTGIDDQWKAFGGARLSSGATTASMTLRLDNSDPDGQEYELAVRAISVADGNPFFTYLPESGYSIVRLSMPVINKTVNTVQGVHIYWNKNAGHVAAYSVYRSLTPSGNYTKIGVTKSTNFTDKTAVSGTKYYYKIRSTYGTSVSAASKAAAKTFVGTPDITTRVNSVGGIRIYWNKINGATGYAIYRKGDGANDKWARVKTIAGNSTFVWTDSSTKPASCNGTIYHYTVRALAGTDRNLLSGCRSTGRTMVRLNKPVVYSMTKKSAGTVLGTWSRNDKATGYEVRFMVGTEVYKTFVYGDNKIVKKTISGLPTGKTYKIQVRSYYKTKSAGTYYSSWSDAVNVKL